MSHRKRSQGAVGPGAVDASRRRLLRALPLAAGAAGLTVVGAPSVARADEGCAGPSLVVSPFGNAAFRTAQALIREHLARAARCTFVIDFRPGAAGVVGLRHALGLARGGPVLLLASTTTTALNPLLRGEADVGRRADWLPVSLLYRMPIVLVSSKAAPDSLSGLVELGRRRPDDLAYASSGIGQIYHLLMEHAKQALGFSAMHVPYKSNHAFSVAANETQLAFASLETTYPLIAAGRLNALAVLTPGRLASLPGTPALAERLPGFECHLNVGLQASANTPPQAVAALGAACNAALASAARAGLDDAGAILSEGHPPAHYAGELEREYRFWSGLVGALGAARILRG